MKPEENDIVRLLRPLPENDLPVGACGTVVMDYAKYSTTDLPQAYEVEFADEDCVTQALVTVLEADLEVVRRGKDGAAPASR